MALGTCVGCHVVEVWRHVYGLPHCPHLTVVGSRLDISKSTLWPLVRAGAIPHIYVGYVWFNAIACLAKILASDSLTLSWPKIWKDLWRKWDKSFLTKFCTQKKWLSTKHAPTYHGLPKKNGRKNLGTYQGPIIFLNWWIACGPVTEKGGSCPLECWTRSHACRPWHIHAYRTGLARTMISQLW
jgi:hypothetical protein